VSDVSGVSDSEDGEEWRAAGADGGASPDRGVWAQLRRAAMGGDWEEEAAAAGGRGELGEGELAKLDAAALERRGQAGGSGAGAGAEGKGVRFEDSVGAGLTQDSGLLAELTLNDDELPGWLEAAGRAEAERAGWRWAEMSDAGRRARALAVAEMGVVVPGEAGDGGAARRLRAAREAWRAAPPDARVLALRASVRAAGAVLWLHRGAWPAALRPDSGLGLNAYLLSKVCPPPSLPSPYRSPFCSLTAPPPTRLAGCGALGGLVVGRARPRVQRRAPQRARAWLGARAARGGGSAAGAGGRGEGRVWRGAHGGAAG
jgi:hypothetical protein